MCRIASLFLLQRLKGSISGDARFQQHRDASCHQVFFSYKARRRRKFTPLEEHTPSHATIKNGVVQFKRGDFSPVMRLVLDDLKQ